MKNIHPYLLYFFSFIFLFIGSYFLYESNLFTNHKKTYLLPCEQTPLVIYSNHLNDSLESVVCQAIQSSKQSVTLFSYSLSSLKVLNEIKKKYKEGVRIHIFYDEKTSKVAEKVLANIPTLQRTHPKSQKLMHRKILVIDEMQVWIGSANMTDASLKEHDNHIVGLYTPQLAQTINDHAQKILAHYPHNLPKEPPYKTTLINTNDKIEFWLTPSALPPLNKVISLIKKARSSLKISMFTWTHPMITKAIIDAHKKGIEVTLIVDSQSLRTTSKKAILQLKKHGIMIKESTHKGLFHHKCCLIDDVIWITGSINWTKNGFHGNVEDMLILYINSPSYQKTLRELWTSMLYSSKDAQFYYH